MFFFFFFLRMGILEQRCLKKDILEYGFLSKNWNIRTWIIFIGILERGFFLRMGILIYRIFKRILQVMGIFEHGIL